MIRVQADAGPPTQVPRIRPLRRARGSAGVQPRTRIGRGQSGRALLDAPGDGVAVDPVDGVQPAVPVSLLLTVPLGRGAVAGRPFLRSYDRRHRSDPDD